ncbi:EAL domain-containing protein [Youhaiella tibetensis]|uniref:EAL domain-containing protein n=1 Tax=Paradevosia tibetensis TaxID=1447062 RepID=A0A5B9DP69_9HYPH|nr:EAL domain-containing protein [Youhaiella tibetensis]QEE20997.1 EAL domain-containing protein [Youhaiella tibetensis]
MKSRYSHIVVLLTALIAFVPVLGVDYLLDNYVRVREQGVLQAGIEHVTEKIQATANAGIAGLRTIVAESPSLCTPTFVGNVLKEMESNLYLRQILVENTDGAQFCDAFGREVKYTRLSDDLGIPGRTETIAVVRLADLDVPAFKITQSYSTTRRISAFVPVLPFPPETVAQDLTTGGMAQVSLTNGTPISTSGDPTPYERRSSDAEFITAQAFAGELPLRVDAALPFALVRSTYSDLDLSFTVIAAAMSGAFLLLMLQYVRRSQLPAFDLERAIQAGEIKPYYQPVVNLATGKIAGCEVLCRWEKRNGQIVPPGSFIDYAEVTGLAVPMTLSLMEQVRVDMSDLAREIPDLKISINLFEGHFRDSTIVEDVQAIFGDSPIGFRQLCFEITERRPIGNSTAANSVIAGLHALGCKLAMDDVGTGHSNLAYMQTLGVDIIKIDRVFVDMVKADTTTVPVLDGLVAMARDLGTEVIAEGVETQEQAIYLRNHGVLMAQGFLFAPALKVAQFRELARGLNVPSKGGVTSGGKLKPAAA